MIVQIVDIYFKNNIGPNTDPCGTLLKTDFQFEASPSAYLYPLSSINQQFFYPVDYTISYAMGL